MLASALIVLSLTVTALAVLDFLLSEPQKKVIADAVIATWNVLDEARKWSFSDWLKNPRASWWLAITLGLFFGVFQVATMNRMMGRVQEDASEVFAPAKMPWPAMLFVAAFTLLIITAITRPIFSRLLKLGKRLWYVIAIAGALYALALIPLVHDEKNKDNEFPTIAFAVFMIVGIPASIIIIVSFTIFFARFLAYLASGVLFVGELIVRRIAEYPKGPIIATSAIFGGLVSLVKMFSG
jgi:hypothetical protein